MPKLLDVYHRMPYLLRVLAASARGSTLNWWRYGPNTDRLVQAALEREQWSQQDWQNWREQRLSFVLQRAATRVPYYRDYWQNERRQGIRRSWDYLENWPVLTKEPLRESPRAFLADDCNPAWMYREHTSGTTGKPLHLWWSRKTVQEWYALFEARARTWNGVTRRDRWAIIGGQLVAPYNAVRPPFWVWNDGLKQLYFSSYHLSHDFVSHYIQALVSHHITYLLGYPSSLYSLARLAAEQGIAPPPMKVILTNAEQLHPFQQEMLANYFQAPVVNTYGMVEIVTAGSQCADGHMHLWPEVGVTEVLSESSDEPIPAGFTGRLIGTGLLNADMPLIRYQIGDRGAMCSEEDQCTCGRPLPILKEVEGRLDDIVLTPDGRRIGRLGPVFRDELPIHEAQVIQETLDTLRVLVVPARGYTPLTGEVIAARLRERVGRMHISVETVEAVPRSANGKYRVIVSRLPPELLSCQQSDLAPVGLAESQPQTFR